MYWNSDKIKTDLFQLQENMNLCHSWGFLCAAEFCNSINKWPSAKPTIWLELTWWWQQFHESIIKPLYLSNPHTLLLIWDWQWTGIPNNNIKSISLQAYFSQQQISKFSLIYMHSKTTSPTTLSENYSVYQNIGKTVIYSNDCSTVSLTLSLNQYDHTLFPIPSSIRDE